MQPSGVNPPGRVPQNRLTAGMDLVNQYNALYPSRAQGGVGVPQEQFHTAPPPALSPQEAAEREARWAMETGQVVGPDRNVHQQYVPPQGPQFSTNPGVIRRAPEPLYHQPQQPYYGPPPQAFPQQAQPLAPPSMMRQFAPVQAIQSIDLERGIVWADGQAFPFDVRTAQQVVYFALEVITGAFASQLGSLLQRYGLVVTPSPQAQGVPQMQGAQAGEGVPQGQGAAPILLQALPRGNAAGLPLPGAVPQPVPPADEGGPPETGGDSEKAEE